MTDSDKWEAASGNILRGRRKLLEPGGRQESKAVHLTERGRPRDAGSRARWPGRAWTRQPAAAGGDPGSGNPLEPAQLSPPGTQRRTPGRAGEGAGVGGALTCGALRPGAGQRRQLQPQEQAEGERGEVRHPCGSGSAPSRGGRGRDWGGRGAAPHRRRGRRRCAPLGSGSRRRCARSRGAARTEAGGWAGAGRGAGGGVPGVLTPPPPPARPALRLGRAHTLARTPAPRTRPRLAHAGSPRTLARPAGSGPLSRTVTRLHSAPPHPRGPRGPLLFARSRATACTVCLAGAQVSGCDGGEGDGELPFELGVGEQVSGGRVLVGGGRGQPSGLGTGSQVNGGDGRGLCPKQEQVSTSEGIRHALR